MSRSILYVDDEAACLDVFSQMFGDEYDVRTAPTAAAARRMLAERAADIVISDQSMPGMDGTEFLAEVAERYPATYRVLLTGRAILGDVIPELSAGTIHLFVPKPWTQQQMRRMLERADLHSAPES